MLGQDCWDRKARTSGTVPLQCSPHKFRPLIIIIASSTEIAASSSFFLCAWLAFVLMLTIFHRPKKKNYCMASFLAASFFYCKKAHQKKFLPQDDEKLSPSAQRQVTHTEKIIGYCNFYGKCNYKNSTQVELRPHVSVSEKPAEFYAQEATGCHQEGGNHAKYQQESCTHYGPFSGPNVYK